MMFKEDELAVLRRAFARQVMFNGNADYPALEEAYASVKREAFLGDGPWPVFQWTGYRKTPDADPAWLYSDILIGLVPERGLNNGQPSGHANWMAAAKVRPGERVVHVGAGVGYYSAILAHMAGPEGRLTAIEFDPALAERARANLASLNATVICGDGSVAPFEPADVIYVNAGASKPADAWLDGLTEGGRLILPLTTNSNFTRPDFTRPSGAVFKITRRGQAFDAEMVSQIAVFPCEGMRDPASEAALAEAFSERAARIGDVRRLARTDDADPAQCWVKAPGWALTY
jgi:protein-L-isoaspartate(D-aspartate) O-methyltransferase